MIKLLLKMYNMFGEKKIFLFIKEYVILKIWFVGLLLIKLIIKFMFFI